MSKLSKLGIVLGVLVALMVSGGERAAAITHTAIGDGNWFTAANWDANGIPPQGGASTDIIDLNGHHLSYSGGTVAYPQGWTGSGTMTKINGAFEPAPGNILAGWTGKLILGSGGSWLPLTGSNWQTSTQTDVLLNGGTWYNYVGAAFHGKMAGFGEAAGNWNAQDFGTGSTVTPGTFDTSTYALIGSGQITFANGLQFSGGEFIANILDPGTASSLSRTGGTVTIGSGSLLDVVLYDAGTDTGPLSWTIMYTGGLTDSAGWSDGSLTGVTFTDTSWGDGNWTNLGVSISSTDLVVSGEFTTGGGPVIPEPSTMLLLGTGALGVLGYLRRRRMS